LEGLYESPKQCSNALASAQQFDQSHHTEESEKVDGNDIRTGLKVKISG